MYSMMMMKGLRLLKFEESKRVWQKLVCAKRVESCLNSKKNVFICVFQQPQSTPFSH